MVFARVLSPLFAALLMSVGASSTQADTSDIGDYTVHYLAVNSTFLEPDIAATYGIERGSRRGFVNVAVLRDDPTASVGKPVTANITGTRANLMQQSTTLEFKEVREGEAIYYLAQFDFSNAETLRFTIEVQPEGEGRTNTLTWTTQLYAD
jgi:hypothetical protein